MEAGCEQEDFRLVIPLRCDHVPDEMRLRCVSVKAENHLVALDQIASPGKQKLLPIISPM
jgi:hypothetical protein